MKTVDSFELPKALLGSSIQNREMSLFNYFKRVKASEALPSTSKDDCNQILTSNEINHVTQQLKRSEANESSRTGTRKTYVKWKPEQKAEIGARALKYGITSALKHFSGKYPKLTKQTVHEFKKAYEKLAAGGHPVKKIEPKKRGRPTLLPETLMNKTITTVKNLRLKGVPVSHSVINAVPRGIVIANDRTMLLEFGGHLYFSDSWARNKFYQMDRIGKKMKRRMATTSKMPISPALLEEEKFTFQRKIKHFVDIHGIPTGLVLNFDQTPLSYVCTRKTTLEVQGTKSVPVIGQGKQKQITGTFTVSADGDFLPMQLI